MAWHAADRTQIITMHRSSHCRVVPQAQSFQQRAAQAGARVSQAPACQPGWCALLITCVYPAVAYGWLPSCEMLASLVPLLCASCCALWVAYQR